MNLKNLTLATTLVLTIPSLALVSCSKKKGSYTVKVTVDDAKTAKVWRDTTGKTKSNAAIWCYNKTNRNLSSAEDSNANDAQLKSVQVTYLDEKGKKVEDKVDGGGKSEFSKEYQVPAGRSISVTAKAQQTGEVVSVDKASNITTPSAWMSTAFGKKAGDATLRLKIDILKDGVIVGSQQVDVPKEAEATAVATTTEK